MNDPRFSKICDDKMPALKADARDATKFHQSIESFQAGNIPGAANNIEEQQDEFREKVEMIVEQNTVPDKEHSSVHGKERCLLAKNDILRLSCGAPMDGHLSPDRELSGVSVLERRMDNLLVGVESNVDSLVMLGDKLDEISLKLDWLILRKQKKDLNHRLIRHLYRRQILQRNPLAWKLEKRPPNTPLLATMEEDENQ